MATRRLLPVASFVVVTTGAVALAALPVCAQDADRTAPGEAASLPADTPPEISLVVPAGTPLRVAIEAPARVARLGTPLRGKVVAPVYAFDRIVIPAGSEVFGTISSIDPVPGKRRAEAYATGDFSPLRTYHLAFTSLVLPDGHTFPIRTSVSPGTAEVVHLAAKVPAAEACRRNAMRRAAEEAKTQVAARAHEAVAEVKGPGRLHRIKQYLLAQLPYRRQYIAADTRFNTALDEPLSFGSAPRNPAELAALGAAPPADSVLHARLEGEVSSATAHRGTPVTAVLTEPLYSPEKQLLLPANTRLDGEVVEARPARRLHHNGELRVLFQNIETPAGARQPAIGNLEGLEVDRRAHVALDEEGGARATDSKTRYLSTGVALLLAAAASRPDVEHGTTDTAGDPAVRTAAGGSGMRVTGALISLASKSSAVSIAFGMYGAFTSVYCNFLSRGRDVVLPQNTALEIGIGRSHPAAQPAKHQ
jgi:type IV secretory pathway VirB10-like protein